MAPNQAMTTPTLKAMSDPTEALLGRRIGITADRRWQEQADLFRKRGADVLHGPSLRTVDLSASESLRTATELLVGRPPDFLLVTTGMGMRMWLEAADQWAQRPALLDALSTTRVLARGAKAASAVRGAGIDLWWQAPHETMDEMVDHLGAEPGIGSTTVAVQLFDPVASQSTEALRGLVDRLVELPVYQWELPLDPGPARSLIAAAIGGTLDAVTFTSQPAVRQLFTIAGAEPGAADRLRAALNGPVVTSCVGHVCAAAGREMGLDRMLWPQPPRLVAMVRQLTDALADPPATVES